VREFHHVEEAGRLVCARARRFDGELRSVHRLTSLHRLHRVFGFFQPHPGDLAVELDGFDLPARVHQRHHLGEARRRADLCRARRLNGEIGDDQRLARLQLFHRVFGFFQSHVEDFAIEFDGFDLLAAAD
jgi:hypothetical protein